MKIYAALCALLLAVLSARGENRFPAPQFESGYAMPAAAEPGARPAFLDTLDVAVLLAALSLAAWFVLKKRSRRGVLLLSAFSLLYFGFWRRGCICPVGSIQNVALWLFDCGYVIPLSAAAFFILPLAFALLFGRVFCADVCPLGVIQDLVVLFPVRIPRHLARALGFFPYLFLASGVLLAAAGAGFMICRYDPFVSFFRLSGDLSALAAGAVMLLVGVFVARPYCRFMCPYGVLLNWMSRLSKWHARIYPDECVQCRLCERTCPFDAILVPNSSLVPEPREKGARRLTALLVLLPALALAGGWAGASLDAQLSANHPVVRLADALNGAPAASGSFKSQMLESFALGGGKADDVRARAAAVREKIRLGGWIAGGFLGAALGLGLIGVSIRRSRDSYEPDRGECLSCARCFMSCPREHLRLRGGGKIEPENGGAYGA